MTKIANSSNIIIKMDIWMTTKDGEIQDFLKTISENVKSVRKQKGYSTLDTANALGHSSHSYVNRIERGENGACYSLTHLYILSKEREIDIGEFLKQPDRKDK